MKVVLEEKKGGGVIIGVSKEDCDPIMSTAGGNLLQALETVPGLITQAEAKWQTAPRNPAYQAPPPPKKVEDKKKEEKKPVPVSPVSKTELPLLAGIKGKPGPEVKPIDDPVTSGPAQPALEIKTPETEITESSTGSAPEPAEQPARLTMEQLDELSKVIHKTGGAPATGTSIPLSPLGRAADQPIYPLATPPAENKTGKGLFLQDGRGPYGSVQEALDALGVPAEKRPHHNRYDRLSNEWKQKILEK